MPFDMPQYEDWPERKRFQEKPKVKSKESQDDVLTDAEIKELKKGMDMPVGKLYGKPGGVRRIRELYQKAERILGHDKVEELLGRTPQDASPRELREQRSSYSNKYNFTMPNGNIEKGPQEPKIEGQEEINVTGKEGMVDIEGGKINMNEGGQRLEDLEGKGIKLEDLEAQEGGIKIGQEGEAAKTPEMFEERRKKLEANLNALQKLWREIAQEFSGEMRSGIQKEYEKMTQEWSTTKSAINLELDKLDEEEQRARVAARMKQIKEIRDSNV